MTTAIQWKHVKTDTALRALEIWAPQPICYLWILTGSHLLLNIVGSKLFLIEKTYDKICIKHKHVSITFFVRCQFYKNYLLREGFVASAGKWVFLMFLYPLGHGHNQIGCSNGGGLTQKKHRFSCKMHSFKTMVVMRFKIGKFQEKNTLEKKTEYISTLKH